MYFLFLIGSGGAIAHHFFYQSLDGQEAVDQLQMFRYGTALAYFTKAALVGSVALAFRQQIWATFRRKMLSISTIDSLFSAMDDLVWILSPEIYHSAKVALLLIIVVWYVEQAAVFT